MKECEDTPSFTLNSGYGGGNSHGDVRSYVTGTLSDHRFDQHHGCDLSTNIRFA